VQVTLSLTLDEALLRAARKVALDRNTSVEQLVREFLTRLSYEADPQVAAMAELDELFRTTQIQIGTPNWTREDLHER
jgi:hypothetical protein